MPPRGQTYLDLAGLPLLPDYADRVPDTLRTERISGGERVRVGMSQTLMDFRLVEDWQQRDILQATLRRMQYEVGSHLVAALYETRFQRAVVDLRLVDTVDDTLHDFHRKLTLLAEVAPCSALVHDLVIPIAVHHTEFFPADWGCPYCGNLVDGLRSPYRCANCGAPRSRRVLDEK